jgi:hypothetical protein
MRFIAWRCYAGAPARVVRRPATAASVLAMTTTTDTTTER